MSFAAGLKRCMVIPAPYRPVRLGPTGFQSQARSWSSFPPRPKPKYYYQRQKPRYSRFDAVRIAWYTNPRFRYGVVAGGVVGLFYVMNLEKVPVTGRTRFNIISPETEKAISEQMYEQTLRQFRHQLLPQWDPDARMVRKVLQRLIPASGLVDEKWEVHVIDDPKQKNAFVIPGGKVFVFSGILPICADEDGLAAVLGHEIAHNVAHHQAESMSKQYWALAILWAVAFFFGTPDYLSQLMLDLGYMRPGSRKQEAEADYIGLMMMAQSCFNPHAAVQVWERMQKAEEFDIPQWLSTHPSSRNRMQKMLQWLPEAQSKLAASDCSGVLEYADDFRQAYSQLIY